ncbi:hypothetical protein AURDEDRAFT_187164 [Auricularia subglabra TFB-10046 SS5]|nr:hypothetical protein AURDEDRAFT_187164 [Auricularia subglabra TFB-10046 SS5]
MASHVLDLRKKRIAREKNDILALEQRTEAAKLARDTAVHAFEQARAVMEEASKEHAALFTRCASAREQLDELCLSYRRDFIASLPLDVLRCIFTEAVALPRQLAHAFCFGNCHYQDYAQAPFVLAAVCRRWRNVALQHPSLWTYISTPNVMDKRTTERHCRRIQMILQRSQPCPLDVLICWTREALAGPWEGCHALHTILKAVLSAGHRWRTFELTLPFGAGKSEYIYALKGPLPLLESFRFISIQGDNEFPTTPCFPFAPRLEEIAIWGPNALLPTPTGLSSLRSLRLWFHLSFAQMLPLISALSATLESLAIGIDSEEAMPSPDIHLALPKLTVLTLDIDQNMRHTFQLFRVAKVHLPALQRLFLAGRSICEDLSPFLEQIAASVGTLTLGDTIQPQHLDILRNLTSLRTLRFDDFNGNGELQCWYDLSDEFFAAVSVDIWPKLVDVHILQGGVFRLDAGSGALAFIQSRTLDAGGPAAPCRLQEFMVGTEVPGWFTAEVARLLQNPKHVL